MPRAGSHPDRHVRWQFCLQLRIADEDDHGPNRARRHTQWPKCRLDRLDVAMVLPQWVLERVFTPATVRGLRSRADPAAARKCPRCGRDMVLRTARQGPNAGGRFWVCAGYPACRAKQEAT